MWLILLGMERSRLLWLWGWGHGEAFSSHTCTIPRVISPTFDHRTLRTRSHVCSTIRQELHVEYFWAAIAQLLETAMDLLLKLTEPNQVILPLYLLITGS
jgi:hypothetical protein